jgi:predicted AAA+ superfamily ATPase
MKTMNFEIPKMGKPTRETDNQIKERLRERFEILMDMTRAVKKGDVRAMIVTGPPGVGKSFGVEEVLSKHDLMATVANNSKLKKYEVVKGAMSALGLYSKLYEFKDAKSILVFDDCDSVLQDELSLNILKAALDSGKRRRICWNSDSSMLRREGVPDQFEFKGSCIFITNLKFENLKSKKLQDHLEALQSRCHFLDLTINTERDKMLRIQQVHRDAEGGLFAEYNLEPGIAEAIFEFMATNQSRLRELSLRMCLKVADLVKVSPTNWRALAENTVMKNSF